MKVRSIDDKGDEVRVAKRFRWENLAGALSDEVGRVPLEKVCELGTLAYVNFGRRFSRLKFTPRRQAVMVEEDSWEQVCSELVRTGICSFLPLADVYVAFLVSQRMSLRMDGRHTGSSWV